MQKNFNLTSRNHLLETFLDNHPFTSETAGEDSHRLFQAMFHHKDTDFISTTEQAMRKANAPHGDYLRQHHRELVQFCVTPELEKGFYDILNKCNQFAYASGWSGRAVRCPDYFLSVRMALPLLRTYFYMRIYNCTLPQYLMNDLSAELLDYKSNVSGGIYIFSPFLPRLDLRIAAGIDGGEPGVREAIVEILFSEQNTAVVTTDIIRGILQSSDHDLHRLLADFLVAARLQEGVRQAVCDNMQLGVMDAFTTLFNVICEHNLIRYSSVRRAIAVWVGLDANVDEDRLVKKAAAAINSCLSDPNGIPICLGQDDTLHLMVGLWAAGFKNVTQLPEILSKFVESGSRQQKFVAAYYASRLHSQDYTKSLSQKAIELYPDNLEIAAAFFPIYLPITGENYFELAQAGAEEEGRSGIDYKQIWTLLPDRESIYRHFAILSGLCKQMKTKQFTISPFLFPGHSVSISRSDMLQRMAIMARALEDQSLVDDVAARLAEFTSRRANYLRLLLNPPQTAAQRAYLIQALADKETYTRSSAAAIVKKIALTQDERQNLCQMLRYKKTDLRTNIIEILLASPADELEQLIATILDNANEDVRLAGLDMLLQLKASDSPERNRVCEHCRKYLAALSTPSVRETILLEQLIPDGEAAPGEDEPLYTLSDQLKLDKPDCDPRDYPLFTITAKKLDELFSALDDLIHEHRMDTWHRADGTEILLGNCKSGFSDRFHITHRQLPEQTPFASLWEEFYSTHIKDFPTLYAMYCAAVPNRRIDTLEKKDILADEYRRLIGSAVYDFDCTGYRYGPASAMLPLSLFQNILESLWQSHEDEEYLRKLGRLVSLYVICRLPREALSSFSGPESHHHYQPYKFIDFGAIFQPLHCYRRWIGRDPRKQWLQIQHHLELLYPNDKFTDVFDYLLAWHQGQISRGQFYYLVFEHLEPADAIQTLGQIVTGSMYSYAAKRLEQLGLDPACETFNPKLYDLAETAYFAIVNPIVEEECKRGDSPAKYTHLINSITIIYGIPWLVRLLQAMGNEPLHRSGYSSYKLPDKPVSLSRLIRFCHPQEAETSEDFRQQIKSSSITKNRLIEVAMYAPQWIDFIEDYLAIPGLKSGCYYFIAHMNESFGPRQTAMIAKYSPLTTELLNQGACDLDWFREAYRTLGDKNFQLLYKNSKYISDSSKHSRARKYTDAALGRVTVQTLETEITQKRNRDLLMSYPLIPLDGKADMLRRYEFIRKFAKESAQFGSMRRSSEKTACDMALQNLAANAGYRDVTRLTLAMETQLHQTIRQYFEWEDLDAATRVKLLIDGSGKTTILAEKDGKNLASIPAAYKKHPHIVALRDIQKKLKEQYRRAVAMLELSMEEREWYSFEELSALNENPVTAPMVQNLVLVMESQPDADTKPTPICGYLSGDGLRDIHGQAHVCESSRPLRIAHSFDLYQSGAWSLYQADWFKRQQSDGVRQPFRQIFRELYVKLPEELNQNVTRLFAGNQIQPRKTAACLQSRRWIADYHNGLQKIYYKDNIVAHIYALADWFSPSEIEAPTLEYVVFYDRKTFAQLLISQVPEIVYSEVMRDVDLAVSVAHAGSVDPETSHSTLEMRQVIARYNVNLFGLKNVDFHGNFAIVKGSRGEFNIHLGSGVIHKMGAHQINVLPVHTQRRGRIFLPFLDEDPKTAEIISKILLFAEDKKIKDPYILQQL